MLFDKMQSLVKLFQKAHSYPPCRRQEQLALKNHLTDFIKPVALLAITSSSLLLLQLS